MSSMELLELFTNASSQQQEVARAAEVTLGRLGVHPGFYPAVARLAVDKNIGDAPRMQAILFLKNAIDTIWRKNRPETALGVALSDEEKTAIRALLLSEYNDKSSQISLQIAVVISKIARFDCPHQWPELLQELANAIDSSVARSDSISHERALFILYHVVKALASKRLAADKRTFHELCDKVFNPVAGYWRAHMSQAGINASSLSPALLCLKTLRYIVVYGFVEPSKNAMVCEFFGSLDSTVQNVVQTLTVQHDVALKENLEKIVLNALKLIGEFQDLCTFDFVRFMASFLDLAEFCSFGICSAGLPYLIQVRSINILKNALMSQDYRYPPGKEHTEQPSEDPAIEGARIRTIFFSDERVRAFCQVLLQRHLILTSEELDVWRTDPELYATAESAEAWKYMLRPASESFFITLVHECYDAVKPLVAQWSAIDTSVVDFSNIQNVLALDAILSGIGLASCDLYEDIDVDALFLNFCLPLMKTQAQSEPQLIIVRRAVWLCSKWIDVKFSKELRPNLYEAVIAIIANKNENIALRITACNTLKKSVDEFEFEMDTFHTYLSDAVSALISLMRDCTEADSQLYALTTLWLVAERAGRLLVGNMDAIVAYVPTLWQSENYMLKGQILNLFTQLVKGLGSDCIALIDGLTTMLTTALNTENPAHVYLLEDGLELWLTLTENCASPIPVQLLSLFRFMPQLLTVQSENLRVCCDVVKAYCLYGDNDFFNAYSVPIGHVFSSIIPEMRNEGIVSVLKAVEMVIRCFGSSSLIAMGDVVIWCVRTIVANEEMMGVTVMCAAVVSFVSIHDAKKLYAVMATAMDELQITLFFRKWLDLIGLISHDLERRKANALGLCMWLTLSLRPVETIFPDIMATLADVTFDVCCEDNGTYIDSLVAYDFGVLGGGDASSLLETEHDKRTQKLRDVDMVYNTSLQTHIVNTLNAIKMNSPETFDNLWAGVDNEVKESLKKFCG